MSDHSEDLAVIEARQGEIEALPDADRHLAVVALLDGRLDVVFYILNKHMRPNEWPWGDAA